MNYDVIAKEVLENIGGRENVQSVAHCATRLRIMVLDEAKINKEAIDQLEGVKGAFFNSGNTKSSSEQEQSTKSMKLLLV